MLFSIRFDGDQAVIMTNILVQEKWYKRTLVANDAGSLWEGLEALRKLEDMGEESKLEAALFISKAKEREDIELALPVWLLSGNKIKVFAPNKGKLELDAETMENILEELEVA